MKTVSCILITIFFQVSIVYSQNNPKDFPSQKLSGLNGPYLGQKLPSNMPEIFAKGIVSLEDQNEYCLAMTPDGKEIYFNRSGVGIMVCSWINSEWTSPKRAAFNEKYLGGEVHITNNGSQLLMNRYVQLDSLEAPGIWALNKDASGWSNAQFLIPMGMRATSTNNGSIYTTDITGYRVEGRDEGIITKWIKTEDGYQKDIDPNGGVNTDSIEAHPFIAPDESYLIFNSRRSGGFGEADLYVCYRTKDGSWSKAVNLAPLNSEYSDWCATVSPDRKFLFFTRNGINGGDFYWVSAKIIEELRPKE